MSRLTAQDIIENNGTQQLDTIIDLEILFLSFDEISALENCYNLKRLTLLDNGLKRISNLNPVKNSLICLCLCDQSISKMENLHLPVLRELHLHRNNITAIGDLSGCPKLRKLWLFQNKLTTITGLHSLPELEECWLQANQITLLDGLEHNQQLAHLGMAGNPVTNFQELTKLVNCHNLKELSFSDIHFGRSPVVDCDGYREFVTLHLIQIRLLDGVKLSKGAQLQAEEAYRSQIKAFYTSLQEVEEEYAQQIKGISAQHQSKEVYSTVLEKEMAAALREMQGLVMDGRNVINKQVTRNQMVLTSNLKSLTQNLSKLEVEANSLLDSYAADIHYETDATAALLFISEYVAQVDNALMNLLCNVASNHYSDNGSNRSEQALLFQPIISSAVDYLFISNQIQRNSGGNRLKNAPQPPGILACELVRLYRVSLGREIKNKHRSIRMFTIMTLDKIENVLKYGWTHVVDTLLFTSNTELLIALYQSVGEYESNAELVEKYSAVLTQQNQIQNNSNNNSSKAHTTKRGASEERPGRLQDSIAKKLFYLVSCNVYPEAVQLKLPGDLNQSDQIKSIELPHTPALQSNLMAELQRVRRVQSIVMDSTAYTAVMNGTKQKGQQQSLQAETDVVFLVPPTSCAEVLQVEFIGVCITPSLKEGVHTIENRLELLTLPTSGIDRSCHVLNNFDEATSREVKRFVDNLLQEVDESHAVSYMKAESEAATREHSLKKMRDEIEKERKGQESTLRDMRQNAANESNGLSHSNSASKLPPSGNQRSSSKR